MKENLTIKKYRGSIFLTQDIASDNELIEKHGAYYDLYKIQNQ